MRSAGEGPWVDRKTAQARGEGDCACGGGARVCDGFEEMMGDLAEGFWVGTHAPLPRLCGCARSVPMAAPWATFGRRCRGWGRRLKPPAKLFWGRGIVGRFWRSIGRAR